MQPAMPRPNLRPREAASPASRRVPGGTAAARDEPNTAELAESPGISRGEENRTMITTRNRGTSSQMAPEQGPEGESATSDAGITQTAWIQTRDKEELIKIANFLKFEIGETVEDARRIIRKFLRDNPQYIPSARELTRDVPTLMTWGGLNTPLTRGPSPRTNRRMTTRATFEEDLDTATIMTQMRKWGCTFDGRDPIAFLERLEELREGFAYLGDNIMLGFPEIMRGNALLWCRNQRHTWKCWQDFEEDFRRRFLPRQYIKVLRRGIQGRTQKTGERYHEYETDLVTMMRRAGIRDESEQLEQLYDNLLPEYKIFVKRREIGSRAELGDLALQYEQVLEEQASTRARFEPRRVVSGRAAAASVAYDRDTCCWRCKQRGHTRHQCRQQARLFCSQCGKDGVLTRICHPLTLNGERAGEAGGAPRPDHNIRTA